VTTQAIKQVSRVTQAHRFFAPPARFSSAHRRARSFVRCDRRALPWLGCAHLTAEVVNDDQKLLVGAPGSFALEFDLRGAVSRVDRRPFTAMFNLLAVRVHPASRVIPVHEMIEPKVLNQLAQCVDFRGQFALSVSRKIEFFCHSRGLPFSCCTATMGASANESIQSGLNWKK
jgi:hypothetical protein